MHFCIVIGVFKPPRCQIHSIVDVSVPDVLSFAHIQYKQVSIADHQA